MSSLFSESLASCQSLIFSCVSIIVLNRASYKNLFLIAFKMSDFEIRPNIKFMVKLGWKGTDLWKLWERFVALMLLRKLQFKYGFNSFEKEGRAKRCPSHWKTNNIKKSQENIQTPYI